MEPTEWMALAAVAGAILGSLSGADKRKQQGEQQILQGKLQRWKPATGTGGGTVEPGPSPWQSLMSGGVSGAQFGANLGMMNSLMGGGGGAAPAPSGESMALESNRPPMMGAIGQDPMLMRDVYGNYYNPYEQPMRSNYVTR